MAATALKERMISDEERAYYEAHTMLDPHFCHLIRRFKLRGLVSTSIELFEESLGLGRIVVLFEPMHYVGLQ